MTPKTIYGSALGTSLSTTYTCPTGYYAIVQNLRFYNASDGAVYAEFYLVPSGGTANDAACEARAQLPARSRQAYTERMVLQPGDTIQSLCGTVVAGTTISVKITLAEFPLPSSGGSGTGTGTGTSTGTGTGTSTGTSTGTGTGTSTSTGAGTGTSTGGPSVATS